MKICYDRHRQNILRIDDTHTHFSPKRINFAEEKAASSSKMQDNAKYFFIWFCVDGEWTLNSNRRYRMKVIFFLRREKKTVEIYTSSFKIFTKYTMRHRYGVFCALYFRCMLTFTWAHTNGTRLILAYIYRYIIFWIFGSIKWWCDRKQGALHTKFGSAYHKNHTKTFGKMSNFHLKFISSEFSRVSISIEMVTFFLTYFKVNILYKKKKKEGKWWKMLHKKNLMFEKANCNFDDDKNISFQCDFSIQLDKKVNR